MKHFYALLFLLPFISTAQDSLFSKVYYDAFALEAVSATESIDDFGVAFLTPSSQGMMVVEVDSLGDQNWVHVFNSGYNGHNISVTSDSGYLISGSYYNPQEQLYDPFVMKLNGDGDTLWTRAFLVANPNNSVYDTEISELTDGSYLITWGNYNEQNVYMANMSTSGVLNWSNILGEVNSTEVKKIGQASDSSIYLIGYEDPWSIGKIIKLDKSGSYLWGKSYPSTPFYDLEIVDDTLYCFGLTNQGFHSFSAIDSSGAFMKGAYYTDMNIQSGDPVLYRHTDTTFLIMKPSEMVADNAVRLINKDGQVLQGYIADMEAIEILDAKSNGVFFLGNGPIYGIKSLTPHIGLSRVDSMLNNASCFSVSWFEAEQILTVTPGPSTYWETFGIQEYPIYPTITPQTLIEVMGCVDYYSSVDEFEQNVRLYPNISTGIFNIEIENSGAFELRVYDLSGKQLVRDEFNWTNYQLDLSALDSGTYQYILRDKDSGLSNTGRLILAK